MAQPQAVLGLPGTWEAWPEPDSSYWTLAPTTASYHANTAGTSSSAPAPAPTANWVATAAGSPLANGHDDAATPSPVTPRSLATIAPSTSARAGATAAMAGARLLLPGEARSFLGLNDDQSGRGAAGPSWLTATDFEAWWRPPSLIRAGDCAGDG
jgi:hypothetical protein